MGGVWAVLFVNLLLLLSGCTMDRDPSLVVCEDDSHCPSGWWCPGTPESPASCSEGTRPADDDDDVAPDDDDDVEPDDDDTGPDDDDFTADDDDVVDDDDSTAQPDDDDATPTDDDDAGPDDDDSTPDDDDDDATPTDDDDSTDDPCAVDADGDGADQCEDCDDGDPLLFPGQVWYLDFDGDGFGTAFASQTSCLAPANYVLDDTDCDDTDSDLHPGQVWYLDLDQDGFGSAGFSQVSCSQPALHVLDDTDCDDADDDAFPGQTWFLDADGDGFGNPVVTQDACLQPPNHVLENTDCDDTDDEQFPGQTWYPDADLDGFGSQYSSTVACDPGPGAWYLSGDDCQDSDASAYPGAIEFCNGQDDNCSGGVDEGCPAWDMASIPTGTFFMGCNSALSPVCWSDEEPLHEVFLVSYNIDITEVTVGDYLLCVDAGACTEPQPSGSSNATWGGAPGYPVNMVDWSQADTYCRWAGKRLPAEAEWEKAARGGCEFYSDCETEARTYPWGETPPSCALAAVNDGGMGCGLGVNPVGQYPAGDSPYGVQDMVGNVFEFVNDWYDSTYYATSPSAQPQGPASGANGLSRGGAYNISVSGDDLTLTRRAPTVRDWEAVNFGFRCAQ